MGYMFLPLRRYADFEGRSRRQEFWLWQLFNFIVMSIFFGGFVFALFSALYRVNQRGGIDWSSPSSSYESSSYSNDGIGYRYSYEGNVDPFMLMEEMGPVTWVMLGLGLLWSLIIFIPNLAVAIRRLHDTDRSGWMILLGLIPLVGAIILLVFYFSEGTRGPNRFGPDPKGPDVGRTFA